MATVVLDRHTAARLREERAAAGSDRWDEVWDNTYMMTPLPNLEHQELVGGFVDALRDSLHGKNAKVYPGANVSDREQDWESNYRCPDVAVYLPTNPAKKFVAHWCGGPDFAVEIVSEDDRTREKIAFYGLVGTRELLIIDRDPWALEMFRLVNGNLALVERTTAVARVSDGSYDVLGSEVLPLCFSLLPGAEPGDRPTIEGVHRTTGQAWDI